jgi:hypothetical protein
MYIGLHENVYWSSWKYVLVFMKICIGLHENVYWSSWKCVLVFMKICIGLHENVYWSSWKCVLVFMKICIGLHENMYWSSWKLYLTLSYCNETWNFWTDFQKILTYKVLRKSVQWEPSCSMRTDRRTDMAKLIVAFLNFVNAPKKCYRTVEHPRMVKRLLHICRNFEWWSACLLLTVYWAVRTESL